MSNYEDLKAQAKQTRMAISLLSKSRLVIVF